MVRSALYVVALVVAVAIMLTSTQASFTFTEEDLASDDSMWALYERWAAHHEVVHGHGEKARRFPIFKNNTRRIVNKYDKKGRYAINIFGDWTFDEKITFATGLKESAEDWECSSTLHFNPILLSSGKSSTLHFLPKGEM
jgi:KDEL-tailed cysteine endopeptidase